MSLFRRKTLAALATLCGGSVVLDVRRLHVVVDVTVLARSFSDFMVIRLNDLLARAASFCSVVLEATFAELCDEGMVVGVHAPSERVSTPSDIT